MKIDGSEKTPLAGARRVGPLDPAERVAVTLVLRRRSDSQPYPDVVGIGRLLPGQRRYLTREEFA
jgi:kumamolisin